MKTFGKNPNKDGFMEKQVCSNCGCKIGFDKGPPDGWELEDGRIVCNACCIVDTKKIVNDVIKNCNYSAKFGE